MTFEAVRRDLIAFRNANSRNPVYTHRASTLVEQLQHLQKRLDPAHERRLRRLMHRTTEELGEAKKNNGRYIPSHQRTRPYRKTR